MPMDGLTLGFIARELHETLALGRVDKITQPERDELMLTIRSQGGNHQLLLSASANHARAHLTDAKKLSPLEPPMFCMLLRKHLTSGRVSHVRQRSGDRILEIGFEVTGDLGDRETRLLICELMGKHSNIMLLRPDGRIIDSIKHVTDDISRVREVLPGLPYEAPPAQGKLPYDDLRAEALEARLSAESGALHKALGACVSGLSALSAKELAYRATGDEDARADAAALGLISSRVAEALGRLPGEAAPRLLLSEDGRALDFCAFAYQCRMGLPQQRMSSLSSAMDEFYRVRDNIDRIQQKSASLHRTLKNNIERCEKKLALQLEALSAAAKMEQHKIRGELITASAHQLKKGMKQALLTNYYDENLSELLVPLDEKLSPAENARRYFKLYQKARSAMGLAAEQKLKTEEELLYLEGQMENLGKCGDEAELNEVREELIRLGYVNKSHNRRQMKALPESKPLHFVSSAGLHILVGKNNLQNDKLTGSAETADTWLHAKDMPGSHVIIASDAVDEATLFEAALLAAHYSKGKGGSNVPVDYTLKKFVKKPSGAKPGFVIYTNQKTLFVTPDEERIKAIKPHAPERAHGAPGE